MSPKTYLVTGANRGIGLSLVTQLLAGYPDAVVYGTARDANAAQLKALAEQHSNFIPLAADITKSETLAAAAEYVAKNHGHVDYLIQNAGLGDAFGPPSSVDLDDLQRMWEVNTRGAIAVYQAFYGLVVQSEEKKIVFVSSRSGSVGGFRPFPLAAYGASKASLNYLVRAAAAESKEAGVKVIAIHPGVVATDMSNNIKNHIDFGSIPISSPEECAESVLAVVHSFRETDQFLDFSGNVVAW